MGLSHMCISILLSYNGSDVEHITANAAIAFFVIVSILDAASGRNMVFYANQR